MTQQDVVIKTVIGNRRVEVNILHLLFILKRLVVQHFYLNRHTPALVSELERIRHEVDQYLKESSLVSVNFFDQCQISWLINHSSQIDFSLVGGVFHHLERFVNYRGQAEEVIVELK